MSYIVDSICLLNSSYSKDKIIKLFENIMRKAGIEDFILLSNIAQVCTSPLIEDGSDILLECGNYKVSFRYKKSANKCILDKKDLECLVAAFIVSIENSVIYKDMTDKIAFGRNKNYPTYDNLIIDISKEIKHYERFGTDFCVAKINMDNVILGEKYDFKLGRCIDELQGLIRGTDSVYSDSRSIYILFRNVGIKDGVILIDKLKSVMCKCQIGIAEWKSSYVVVDLMSEIDNYIYLSAQKEDEEKTSIVDELNKILNRALFRNEDIIIVKTEEVDNLLNKYVVLSFNINNCSYSVIRNCKNTSNFSFLYKFAGDEIAQDILNELKNIK